MKRVGTGHWWQLRCASHWLFSQPGSENPVNGVLATALRSRFGHGWCDRAAPRAHHRFGRSWQVNAVALRSAVSTGFWLRHWAAKHQVHYRVPAVYPDDAFTNVAAVSCDSTRWHG